MYEMNEILTLDKMEGDATKLSNRDIQYFNVMFSFKKTNLMPKMHKESSSKKAILKIIL